MAIHKLTVARIAKLNKDGMYGDGGGLWLQVTGGGSGKSWLFRWTDRQTGKGRSMGLGPIYKTDIDDARALAKAQWQLIGKGLDPVVERDGAKLDQAHKLGLAKTVNQVLDEYFEARMQTRQAETKKSAVNILKYARKTIGKLPIQKIDTNMILDKVGLRRLWKERHNTGEKLQSHLERAFSFAIVSKYFIGENPARWEDHLDHVLAADGYRSKHQASLPYQDVGRFMQVLRSWEDSSHRGAGRGVALWLEFCVLSGCRVSEPRLARWNHIDRKKLIWIVPPENHKTGNHSEQPILRPISKPMLDVLDEMERQYPDHAPDALIFPSTHNRNTSVPYDYRAVSQFINMSLKWPMKITAHGFRSTLIDWCRNQSLEWGNLVELQCGHVVGSKVKQAYARDPLVDKRRPMMETWGQYCSRPAPEPIEGTNVEYMAERRKRKTGS